MLYCYKTPSEEVYTQWQNLWNNGYMSKNIIDNATKPLIITQLCLTFLNPNDKHQNGPGQKFALRQSFILIVYRQINTDRFKWLLRVTVHGCNLTACN